MKDYFNQIVEAVKNRLPEYLDGLGAKKAVDNTYHCVFTANHEHGDRTPSLNISHKHGIWLYKCFGCGEAGTVYDMVAKIENRDISGIGFIDTTMYLANKFGIPIDEEELNKDEIMANMSRIAKQREMMLEINKYILVNGNGLEHLQNKIFGRTYSKNQAEEILELLPVGCINADKLTKHLYNIFGEGIKELDFYNENTKIVGNGVFGEDRLSLAILDEHDRPLGYKARLSDEYKDKNGKFDRGKYAATPKLKKPLFLANNAKEAIKKEGKAYIVEGEFDSISMHLNGYKNTIGLMGSSLTRKALQLLITYGAYEIVFALDNGIAGYKGTKKAIEESKGLDICIRVAELPEGMDPDTLLLSKNNKPFETYIDAISFILKNDKEFNEKSIPYEIRYNRMLKFVIQNCNTNVLFLEYSKIISEITETPNHIVFEDLKEELKNKGKNNPEYIEMLETLKEIDYLTPQNALITLDRTLQKMQVFLTKELGSVKNHTRDMFNRLLRGDSELPHVFKTGYYSIDSETKIESRSLVFLGGPPSNGKSSVMKAISLGMLEQDKDVVVVYISLDDTDIKTMSHFISLILHNDKDHIEKMIRNNTLNKDRLYIQNEEKINSMFSNSLHILGRRDCPNMAQVKLKIESLKRSNDLKDKKFVIIIDAMDDLTDLNALDQRIAVETVVSDMSQMAEIHDACVVAIKHLKKSNYKIRRPILDDFKGSAKIEYFAKVALLVYSPVHYDEDSSIFWMNKGLKQPVLELTVAKDKDKRANQRLFLHFSPEIGSIMDPPEELIHEYKVASKFEEKENESKQYRQRN